MYRLEHCHQLSFEDFFLPFGGKLSGDDCWIKLAELIPWYWFNGQGVECRQVMSDNGPAYVSRRFHKACKVLSLKHIRTRPYMPRTNSKAERFVQTLCQEWAYGMPCQNSEESNQWLPHYLSIYNHLRKQTALGSLSSG